MEKSNQCLEVELPVICNLNSVAFINIHIRDNRLRKGLIYTSLYSFDNIFIFFKCSTSEQTEGRHESLASIPRPRRMWAGLRRSPKDSALSSVPRALVGRPLQGHLLGPRVRARDGAGGVPTRTSHPSERPVRRRGL